MPGKKLHLTLEERESIESCLKDGLSFKETARVLGRDPSTISREVRKHRTLVEKRRSYNQAPVTNCTHRASCSVKRLCPTCTSQKYCKNCFQRKCTTLCSAYDELFCTTILKPPYVCNGCNRSRTCPFDKYYYRAKCAHRDYLCLLASSRAGISLLPAELEGLDRLVSPLVRQGQSIAHICRACNGQIPCSPRTLYSYVSQGLFSVTDLDLRRKVSYKKRRHKKAARDYRYRQGRTYEDFLRFTADNPGLPVSEMDTVEGAGGGAVLLTMYCRHSHFMSAFKMDAQSTGCTLSVFDALEGLLGTPLFRSLFPVILTDNGSEFKDPGALERLLCAGDGLPRTRIFYCDPGKACQKGAIEKNHEFIRYVVPKGRPFDPYAQEDIDLLLCHINSYARSFGSASFVPFEVMAHAYPAFIEKMGYGLVPPQEIRLIPRLLKK